MEIQLVLSADIVPVILLPSSAYTTNVLIWPPATFTFAAAAGFRVAEPNAGVAVTVADFGAGFGFGLAVVVGVDEVGVDEVDEVAAVGTLGSVVPAATPVGCAVSLGGATVMSPD